MTTETKKWRVQITGWDEDEGGMFDLIETYEVEANNVEEASMKADDLFLKEMKEFDYDPIIECSHIDELDKNGNIIAGTYEV